MRPKLSPEEHERLLFLSRTGKGPSELSKIFHVSRETIERYKYPHLRELSRKAAKMQNEHRNDPKVGPLCPQCKKPMTNHPICEICEVFIHVEMTRCGRGDCGKGVPLH